ncbi:MAG: hypothetical protein AB9861_00660 [Methanosarcina sp.]|jgi:hypothetical protein
MVVQTVFVWIMVVRTIYLSRQYLCQDFMQLGRLDGLGQVGMVRRYMLSR